MDISRAQIVRIVALAALWALSFTFMVIGTATFGGDADPAQRAWFSWGLIFCALAHLLTSWQVVAYYTRRERVRFDDVARVMAREHARITAERGEGTVVNLRS